MIDLETWGTRPTSLIRSMGLVLFDAREIVERHEWVMEDTRLPEPYTVDIDTVMWWGHPDQAEASKVLQEAAIKHSLEWVLGTVSLLFARPGMPIEEVWCCGADFDFPILDFAFRAETVVPAWEYWQQRDFRTLKKFFPQVPCVKPARVHQALADAEAAALHVIKVEQYLRSLQSAARSVEAPVPQPQAVRSYRCESCGWETATTSMGMALIAHGAASKGCGGWIDEGDGKKKQNKD